MALTLGRFAGPVFGGDGDYPQAFKDILEALSTEKNMSETMLPQFTDAEMAIINGNAAYGPLQYLLHN